MPDRTVDPAVSRKRDDPAINTANIARSATVIPEVKRLASKPVVRMENTEVSSLRFMVSFERGQSRGGELADRGRNPWNVQRHGERVGNQHA